MHLVAQAMLDEKNKETRSDVQGQLMEFKRLAKLKKLKEAKEAEKSENTEKSKFLCIKFKKLSRLKLKNQNKLKS